MHNKSHTLRRLLLVIVFVLSLSGAFTLGTVTGMTVRPASAADEPSGFGIFWEVWDLVNRYFVDQDLVDPAKMTYGAIHGMLATLGDENHTAFFSPEEAEQQESSLEGSFEGIGAFVGQEEGQFRIVAPIHGSPAEAAGILAGDVVLQVDGDDITGLPEWEIISRIRGPADTQVTLTVLHPEETDPVDITVTRGKIEIDSVTWRRIPDTDLVYLQISQFAADTGNELQDALKAIQAEADSGMPVAGILLDLRNNPGGYLAQALRVNSQFLDKGKVILHERDADGELRTYKAVGAGLGRSVPMIVMINEGTASAGEITAGALQENGRARLVGETTTGTGTVLQPFTLSDGSVLRLGVTNWLTPAQNLIKNVGVKPDLEVAQEASVEMVDSFAIEEAALQELLDLGDLQFNTALDELRTLTGAADTAEVVQ
jgi:carboxyl-terminal processing protease